MSRWYSLPCQRQCLAASPLPHLPITSEADWKTPNDVKAQHGNASIVGSNRIVFNIKGNDFRLIAAINYGTGIVYFRFIGTHKEYYRIDATTI